jgi:hypothetical protein
LDKNPLLNGSAYFIYSKSVNVYLLIFLRDWISNFLLIKLYEKELF